MIAFLQHVGDTLAMYFFFFWPQGLKICYKTFYFPIIDILQLKKKTKNRFSFNCVTPSLSPGVGQIGQNIGLISAPSIARGELGLNVITAGQM